MRNRVEHRFSDHGIGTSVTNDGRITEIIDMIGASCFIEYQIPVDPVVHTVIQISDDIVCIAERMLRSSSLMTFETRHLHTTLAVHQRKLWKILPNHR